MSHQDQPIEEDSPLFDAETWGQVIQTFESHERAEWENKKPKFPVIVRVGFEDVQVSEEDVRMAQREMLEGRVSESSKRLIDALLSWFCVSR